MTLQKYELFQYPQQNLESWRDFTWRVGVFSLGELACFHLESWRVFTWRVGAFLLGELAVANMFFRYSANEKRNSCTFA